MVAPKSHADLALFLEHKKQQYIKEKKDLMVECGVLFLPFSLL